MTKSQLQQSDCRLNCARRSVDLDRPRPITSVRVDLNASLQRLSGATCNSAGQSATTAGVCVSEALGTAGGEAAPKGSDGEDSQLSRWIMDSERRTLAGGRGAKACHERDVACPRSVSSASKPVVVQSGRALSSEDVSRRPRRSHLCHLCHLCHPRHPHHLRHPR